MGLGLGLCGACCAVTTVSGNVQGCTGTLAVSGMTVDLTDPGSVNLASVTTDSSGHYTATISISGTVTVTVTVTPSSSRFATTASNVSVTSGTNATKNVALSPATDYHCVGGCNYPVYKDITVVDPTYGTYTASWTSSLAAPFAGQAGWTTGFQSLSYPGGGVGGCAAGTLTMEWVMLANIGGSHPGLDGGYWALSAIAGSCPAATNTHIVALAWGSQSITTCPGASTAPTFVGTASNIFTAFEPTAPYTITYQE